jgi:hypothetical protein
LKDAGFYAKLGTGGRRVWVAGRLVVSLPRGGIDRT